MWLQDICIYMCIEVNTHRLYIYIYIRYACVHIRIIYEQNGHRVTCNIDNNSLTTIASTGVCVCVVYLRAYRTRQSRFTRSLNATLGRGNGRPQVYRRAFLFFRPHLSSQVLYAPACHCVIGFCIFFFFYFYTATVCNARH